MNSVKTSMDLKIVHSMYFKTVFVLLKVGVQFDVAWSHTWTDHVWGLSSLSGGGKRVGSWCSMVSLLLLIFAMTYLFVLRQSLVEPRLALNSLHSQGWSRILVSPPSTLWMLRLQTYIIEGKPEASCVSQAIAFLYCSFLCPHSYRGLTLKWPVCFSSFLSPFISFSAF